MEYKIINIGDYLLIVDDSEIKEGDTYCRIDTGLLFSSLKGSNPNIIEKYCKKIIAHLPLNNLPILEGVILLPSLEDEVEKLAQNIHYDMAQQGLDANGCFNQYQGFIKGYNKAKEKYKYTEDDLRKAIEVGVNAEAGYYPKGFSYKLGISLEDYFIQSLKQPKMPTSFKRKESGFVISGGLRTGDESQPPGLQTHTSYETTTNSQGITQWVGEYIY
jgi:hypothetical protein